MTDGASTVVYVHDCPKAAYVSWFVPAGARLAITTMALVAAVRLGVWTLPFRTMQRVCGDLAKPGKPRQAPSADTLEIARAVRLASRYVPRATCLVQALAAQILLGRHGHSGEVHIGVALDPKLGFRAHAWVKSQGKVLVGGSEELDSYAPMLVLNANGPHDATQDGRLRREGTAPDA